MRGRRALLALLAAVAVAAPVPAEAAIPAVSGQSTYHPVAPTRVLDTRTSTGGHHGALGQGQTLDLVIPGTLAGSQAVVLNVTAVGATTGTVVRVYPKPATASSPPVVSNLNVLRATTVANLVVVRLGSGAAVRFHNTAGSVHLVADLAGFYVQGGQGDGFFGTAPRRLLDTRDTSSPLQANAPRTLPVGSAQGVPADASAVVLNVTAVHPSQPTVIKVYPGSSPPTVSNLNPAAGAVVANLVVVRVDGASDTVTLLSGAGSTDLVVDLAGWYVPGSGSVFHPVNPFRALDTRGGAPVAAGAPRSLVLAGATSLPWVATALAVNLTAVQPSANTRLTLYPAQSESPDPPLASNLNLLHGQVLPNAVVVAAGEGGAIRIANATGTVHVVVDVAGWFGPAGDGWDLSWPQCTSGNTSVSTHPDGGAFAVVGVTHKPFNPNPCLADEWAWASTLDGPPAVYLNTDADKANPHWADAGPKPGPCNAQQETSDCGFNYGWNLAGYAAPQIPAAPDGGKPFVWLDVEGPYAGGPFWTGQVAANRAVVSAAIQRLRTVGYRVGIYSDRASSTAPDWVAIMGAYARPDVQDWVFRAPDANAAALCSPAESFSAGPVVMVQVQPGQSGQTYDVDHAC